MDGAQQASYAAGMDAPQVKDDADLAARIAAGPFLLFKHSLRCPISARAFDAYRAFASAHPTVATAWIDVVAQRSLAGGVAATTGVAHESPQALWFRDGRVVEHASHAAITEASLERMTTR